MFSKFSYFVFLCFDQLSTILILLVAMYLIDFNRDRYIIYHIDTQVVFRQVAICILYGTKHNFNKFNDFYNLPYQDFSSANYVAALFSKFA